MLLVCRRPEIGVEAFVAAGYSRDTIVVSDNCRDLQEAIVAKRPALSRQIEHIRELKGIEVVVEATGTVEYGAQAAIHAIAGDKHVVMMNAEADATVGCALKQMASNAGLVYTSSDGDQPGVLKRLIDHVELAGFEVVAAVNCKGFLDVHATPKSIGIWAERQNMSLRMTTNFTDGTKMNLENCVVSNATGLVPEVRGMHGVRTDMPTALNDCLKVFRDTGLVDYTLGGNFGGGVFVIASGDAKVQPYMKYLKMGDGPHYIFFRPYHLCHIETPVSIAEAVLDGVATIAPLGAPISDVIAIAKKDLASGDTLDGTGGYTVYGQIDVAENSRGWLPIGLTDNVTLNRVIAADEPIPVDAVNLEQDSFLMRLRREQDNAEACA